VADDTAAMQAWVAYLNASSKNVGELGAGVFAFNTTLSLTTGARAIVGPRGGYRTGSAQLGATLKWTGGASPMFQTDTTRHLLLLTFGVDTNGTATDFLEMNSGSQTVLHGPSVLRKRLFHSLGHSVKRKPHRIFSLLPSQCGQACAKIHRPRRSRLCKFLHADQFC